MSRMPATRMPGLSSLKMAKWLAVAAVLAASPLAARAQTTTSTPVCVRPAPGSDVAEPEDLRSKNGVLDVELFYRKIIDTNGSAHYCYIAPDGSEAPNLRVRPGDLLILRLKNEIAPDPLDSPQSNDAPSAPVVTKAGAKPVSTHTMAMSGECAGKEMTASATNIHFHGLDVPPVCHQDDVLNTLIEPGAP